MASARRPVGLHDEAFGLVIGGLSLFILLSLLSWSRAASISGDVSPAANWGGPVGHRIASTLIHALGGGAFLVVGLLGHAAHLCYTHARRQQRLALGLGGMLLLLGAAPLLQIGLAQARAFMGDAGGVVGRWLGAFLLPYCNVGGTLLISAIVAALGGMIVVCPRVPVGRRGVLGLRSLGSGLCSLLGGRRGQRRASTRRRPWSWSSPSVVVAAPLAADHLGLTDAMLSTASSVSPPLSPEPARRLPTEVPGVTAYRRPPLSLFKLSTPGKPHGNGAALVKQAAILAGKLHDFGVDGGVVQVLPGPVVTMYEFQPASGIKVSRIVNLADDLALGMKALSVRIVAPVPGKSVVGIEVPNPHRQPVSLHDIVASPASGRLPRSWC